MRGGASPRTVASSPEPCPSASSSRRPKAARSGSPAANVGPAAHEVTVPLVRARARVSQPSRRRRLATLPMRVVPGRGAVVGRLRGLGRGIDRHRRLDRRHQRLARDQPRRAAAGQERERPASDDHDPVREADQVRDVDQEPQQPGGEPALLPERAHPRDVRHAAQPADDRDVAVVAVAERLHRLPAEPREDGLGRVRAALDAALGDAGRGAVLLPRLDRRVADDEDLRVARDREVRPDAHPAVAIRLGAGGRRHLAPERRGQDARGPEHGVGVDLLGRAGRRLHADQAVLDVHDLGLRAHDHAAASRAGAAPRRIARAGRSRARGPSPRPARSGRPAG